MIRKKAVAFLLPLALVGAAFAGGEDCHGHKKAAAGTGHHCLLSKNVSKTAKMTEDGAVVTLEGKTEEAVRQIKAHFESHEKGEGCADCPMAAEDVTSKVRVTDKGGEITLSASTPESVKKVQDWASKPAGACCGNKKAA